ncbi:hypothetical protein BDV24DRAFT_155204 [Aspergillus arachidicola]|uniref:Uncharacterized protein n=1 Tax=Aspergillus arachidicola TaxID=656916 RepID=A0A5N6XY03_9EURO|nr:hypothetical protein BDV24DRAFT_155204 [Aspergillus arachidicola]
MKQTSRQAHNPFHESNSPQDEPCSLCASLMGSADMLARDFGRHRWAQQCTFKGFSFGLSHPSKYLCGVTLYGVQASEAEAYRTTLAYLSAASTWHCFGGLRVANTFLERDGNRIHSRHGRGQQCKARWNCCILNLEPYLD